MFEMLVLLEHGRLIDVVVRCNAMIVGILGELLNIQRIVPADVHVEKHHVAVHVLFFKQVLRVLTDLPASPKRSATSGRKKPPIGTDVDPEPFLAA
jgi:hypothetical protein